MAKISEISQEQSLDVVGSSTYGRDPKIMSSRTFNMIIADEFLIDYAGYKKIQNIGGSGVGRGLFSTENGFLIAVLENKVYRISLYSETDNENVTVYDISEIGEINSFYGDVYFAKNITGQIAICDQKDLWIYNYFDQTFQKAALPEGISPGYVTYQDGYFIVPNVYDSRWFLSAPGNGLVWDWGTSGAYVNASIQTKGTSMVACVRFPGRGNLLLVLGKTVSELWTDSGKAEFPYVRSSSINLDYGCLSSSTIAENETMVVWLAANEKSGPIIMYTNGSEIQQLSTDGINYRLSQLKNPQNSVGFFLNIAGHLIYQITFYDIKDNWSLIYDFTTKNFFDVTDENMNYHIARSVSFYNGKYYFLSLNDNGFYRLDPSFYTYDYGFFDNGQPKIYEIPRKRVTKNYRLIDSSSFIVNNLTVTLEQGVDDTYQPYDPNYQPTIGLCVSKNGGLNFSSEIQKPVYPLGTRINKTQWWRCGFGNDFVFMINFHGKSAWKITTGQLSTYL